MAFGTGLLYNVAPMRMNPFPTAALALSLPLLLFQPDARGAKFLFDANHAEADANADWVVDADLHNGNWNSSGNFTTGGNESNPQRIPTPAASGISAATAETYWQGALSSWGVDLVKRGHSVETLPANSNLVWNTGGAQDLTNYDVVVICEPNTLLKTAEKQALMNFLLAGGGLFMIADHTGSDRNNDGVDSVGVWRDFLTNNGISNNAFGLTLPTSDDYNGTSSTSTRNPNTSDPIVYGPVGTISKIQYFNGCRFAVSTNVNPTVVSHVWFGTAAADRISHCALASVSLGLGRAVLYGDSSAPDDGTGDPNDTLFNGYSQANVQHRAMLLNASEWLAAPATNVVLNPPQIAVTNPAVAELTVPSTQTAINVSGTSTNIAGLITWTNARTGASGTLSATSRWSVSGIALGIGSNIISVAATNTSGVATSDGLLVVRPSLTSPPQLAALTNRFALWSNTVTFAVTATPTDGDPVTLTVSNAPAGSAFYTTNAAGTFVWTNAGPAGAYTPTFYAADTDGVVSASMTILITNTPVVLTGCVSAVLLSENFDAATSLPTNWIGTNASNDSVLGHYLSPSNCRAMALNSVLITPAVNYPTQLVFYVDASSGGNNKTGAVDYAINGGAWTSVSTFVASTAGLVVTNPLTSAPNLSTFTNVRFRFSSSFNTWYVDDVVVRGQDCSGTSSAQAVIGLAGSLAFGGVPTGTVQASTLTITNAGDAALNVSGLSVPAGFGGDFVGIVPPASATNVMITFAPAAMQAYGGSIVVDSDAAAGSSTLACSGTGVVSIVGVSGSLAFGNVPVGATTTAVLTITNAGNLAFDIADLEPPAGFSAAFSGTLAPFTATNVTVTFAPVAAQAYGGSLRVDSYAMAGTGEILCSGTGTVAIVALEGDLAFGLVPTGLTQTATLTISNAGNAALTVTNIVCPAGFSATLDDVLAPGSATNVAVTFAPLALQAYGGSLVVQSDAASGTSTLPCSGTGAVSVIGLSGDLAFGLVRTGATANAALTITNSGNLPFAVTGLTLPVGFTGSFTGTVPAQSATQLTIVFAPTALQTYGGGIVVLTDAMSGDRTIPCTGTGAASILAVSGNLAFGDVITGQTASLDVTLTNSGNLALTVTNIAFPAGFSGTWTGSLAAGSATNLPVTFAPLLAVAYTGTVAVQSDATAGSGLIDCSGTGVVSATAILALSPSSLSFGATAPGTSNGLPFAVRNLGELALTGTVAAMAPFAVVPADFSVAPGATGLIAVSFAPAAVGWVTGEVVFVSNGGTVTGTVTGLGAEVPMLGSPSAAPPETRVLLSGDVNPGGLPTSVWFDYGLTTAYGSSTIAQTLPAGVVPVAVAQLAGGLTPGLLYHYRLAASNELGAVFSTDATFLATAAAPGDVDGNGIVSQVELDGVLSNYWPSSAFVYITNAAAVSGNRFILELPNPGAWSFTVESSTNLTTWTPFTNASPGYLFTDPRATNATPRSYRLRWP